MLSIVIPTYNEAEYLPYLLRSIKNQTYKDYEVIIGDRESIDGTVEIAKGYGVHIVPGGHPAEGRNQGAKIAQGEIILFLDADVILPDSWFLQMTVAEFEKRKLGCATCRVLPLSDKITDKMFHHVYNFYMWLTRKVVPHAPGFCIFVRKDIHDRIGGFDEDIKLAEDHDYIYRAAQLGKFGLLKTYKIPVSVRRFDRDGRLKIARKFLLAEIHLRTKGNIRTDIFNYTWGYDKEASSDDSGHKKLKSPKEFARKFKLWLKKNS